MSACMLLMLRWMAAMVLLWVSSASGYTLKTAAVSTCLVSSAVRGGDASFTSDVCYTLKNLVALNTS